MIFPRPAALGPRTVPAATMKPARDCAEVPSRLGTSLKDLRRLPDRQSSIVAVDPPQTAGARIAMSTTTLLPVVALAILFLLLFTLLLLHDFGCVRA
jgi:hypothetical protein